jgi:uroporphyrinogen decarboxylase
MADHLFLRACRREAVERTPIWLMRQAGRYMHEYRAIRKKVSFLELCKTPELACEVTMQPIDEFGFDAAILFCDILIPLEKMGLELNFTPAPILPNPVRDRAGIDKLVVPDPELEMPYVYETIRHIRKALGDRAPLIGFAGAPFTLATYAVEGGGSKSYEKTKGLIFSDPSSGHVLLEKLALCCASYLEAQIAAGAQCLQLFDSWAGILTPPDFAEFALRHANRVIELIHDSKAYKETPVPIIYFANGCAPYLDELKACKADVLGVDWKADLAKVWTQLGSDFALQGNLDSSCLFMPKEALTERIKGVLAAADNRPGHIFNLGHGILPSTDRENVRHLVETVKTLSAR